MAAQAVTSPCFRTADPCSKGLRTIRSFEKGVESHESELLVGEKGFRMASLLSYRPFLFPHPILSSSTLYPNIGTKQSQGQFLQGYESHRCCRIAEMPSIVKWPVQYLSGWRMRGHRGPGGGDFSHSFSCLQVALQGPSNSPPSEPGCTITVGTSVRRQ